MSSNHWRRWQCTFLKNWTSTRCPRMAKDKKVFKIHLVSLDRIIYKRILNNILIYWHQVNLWELCLFTERIKDFKRNYLLWVRKVMIYLQPLFLSCSVRYPCTTKIIQFFYLKRLQAMEFEYFLNWVRPLQCLITFISIHINKK